MSSAVSPRAGTSIRPADAPARSAAPRRFTTRRLVLSIAGLALLVVAALYGAQWWSVGRFIESTDDAYIRADQVAMAPRVSGYVREVLVADNQTVSAGQPLVRIEDDTYRAALTRQSANLRTSQADIAVAQARLEEQRATTDQAAATLAGANVAARYAAQEAERYHRLVASGAETAETLARMVNNRDMADATVRSDTAALRAAQRMTGTMQAQIAQAKAQAVSAQASIHETSLDVEHTLVRASIAGRVGDRTVVIGQFVQPGTRMMTIVPVAQSYLVANFKETQVGRMRIGQSADIEVDALDGRILHGVIDSFSPGTGAEFSLLPPENATGNFTKIVQRVPVRLRIDTDEATRARLLTGLSVTVSVDTRSGPHQ